MTEYSIQTLMQKAVNAFQPERAAGIDATIQFNITGSQGGSWVATIRDQKISVEPGVVQNPDLMFGADTADILDVVSGKLNPMHAYVQGKVQFKGDMGLAMRMMELFKRP